MRAVIQRVREASCSIEGIISGKISRGLMVLLAIEDNDTDEDMKWLAQKITNIRIFSDENDLMNKALSDIQGEILLVSQFTLFASTKKGNRPGFTRSAKPDFAIPMYEKMISELGQLSGTRIQTGVFGADMQISLVNDGPVTIVIDTKSKE